MKMKSYTLLLLLLSCHSICSSSISKSNSFVISKTDSTKESPTTITVPDSLINPNIYSMHIQTNISNHFAKTLVTSKVRNIKNKSAETTFSIILPENAFVSQFEMEIGGKIYKANVKRKEEAKKIFGQAVSQGQSAGHVELSARDSKTFTVSVNIEPESETTFRLIYKELLQKQSGLYDFVVNIHPRQIVDDLKVKVYINGSRSLTVVKTPSLQTGNEISKNDDKLNPSAAIELISANSAVVTFNPDTQQQKKFAQLLGGNKENGLAGQFIVQYDMERDPQEEEDLKERELARNKTLNLALKYSCVTSVNSLVVVKPNKTDAVDSKNIKDSKLERSYGREERRHLPYNLRYPRLG